ncbi:3-oxoacyl-[acyl-carrier-protein] reductase FabG [Achromobacter denitrificans]|jgi:3-oxoacyl-[acyl-carrier protein] reductase|uniref:3-oxoacyl-ACP reductase FabG n=1 Tax=Achromobacter denitrificans TaxID=32002 RepID=A0A6N0JQZ4_ACHDE|nr:MULTISPECIES: 3-oxoacyl-ACP reductase family protein [Achromobacter]OLU07903.1 oxidoreductase [Achromobacter denitrificans]QKH44992.1 3-oxoacyl-ACP reductase FabG [Achromobacter denitrificans]QKH53666.1 3-oxoacyl-ACP reductase FabG [Achromobacter denitrificans]QKQ49589.1 3-oxoacyl-ACP reductase FabG [Achromobacter denitrificans]CAB3713478.1 Cyclic-di-GMP-binding biofilm dispersal mediator protein [Achromobacter denitrificans]
MPELTGKIAFVTGGSRGIGAAIVRRLAADGANVAFTYVSPSSAEGAQALARELSTDGRRALAIQADASDADAVRQAIEQAIAELGPVDVLVNNAGVFITGPIGEARLDDYERTMDINVRAPFVAIQAAQAVMPDGGRIINIGSCLAARAGRPGVALYSASKAALVGLTQGLARDLGPRGITVNVVHPGPIDTDMNPADGAHAGDLVAVLALPHYGETRDIAGMVAFLAGPEGRYITGASLAVDGGFAA